MNYCLDFNSVVKEEVHAEEEIRFVCDRPVTVAAVAATVNRDSGI